MMGVNKDQTSQYIVLTAFVWVCRKINNHYETYRYQHFLNVLSRLSPVCSSWCALSLSIGEYILYLVYGLLESFFFVVVWMTYIVTLLILLLVISPASLWQMEQETSVVNLSRTIPIYIHYQILAGRSWSGGMRLRRTMTDNLFIPIVGVNNVDDCVNVAFALGMFQFMDGTRLASFRCRLGDLCHGPHFEKVLDDDQIQYGRSTRRRLTTPITQCGITIIIYLTIVRKGDAPCLSCVHIPRFAAVNGSIIDTMAVSIVAESTFSARS